MPAPVSEALADVSRLGPFFAATANPAEAVDPTWRPCRELYADPSVLRARIDLVARVLGTADRRVAASIAFQGLAARLLSPVLASAAVHGVVPEWSPESLHWRPAVSGPWPLWESAARARATDRPDAVVQVLVEPHLTALVAATRAVESVSTRVLWGNAGSALVAAAAVIGRERPDAAERTRRVLDALLAAGPPPMRGRPRPGGSFRRGTCCLYYRVPGGGICGDCVLGD